MDAVDVDDLSCQALPEVPLLSSRLLLHCILCSLSAGGPELSYTLTHRWDRCLSNISVFFGFGVDLICDKSCTNCLPLPVST